MSYLNISLNKLGSTEDVANAVVFLASDEAKYITDSIINVDGELILNIWLYMFNIILLS